MSPRRLFTAIVLSALSAAFIASATVFAQSVPPDDVANSRYQALGQVNANAVYVRSGPSEHDYATMKLDKGAQVTVVGVRFDWLKIVPPQGSFCYVAKAFVERRGNGQVGRVNNTINVRVGSQLTDLKTKVQTKLDPGADVQILGEKDEYFKIVPPDGVYLYVNKNFVDVVPGSVAPEGDPVRPLAQQPAAEQAQTDQTAVTQTPDPEAIATPDPADDGSAIAEAPASTQPADDAVAKASEAFDTLESDLIATNGKSIEEQNVGELLTAYQALVADGALPESMRRIAEHRIENLKIRVQMRDDYLALKQSQEQMKQRQVALQAEREEIQQRIEQNKVQFFTALGTLRVSSIQRGNETLYRLTDPNTGRTIVYIRSNEAEYGKLMGQFIGVVGDVSDDAQLGVKVLTPTSAKLVDMNRVNNGIIAQMSPPSLLGNATHVSTGTD